MAFLGKGTVLKIDTGGGSYATVGKITELSAPSQSADSVEITHMGSTSEFREFMAGLRDAGEVSATIQLDFGDTEVGQVETSYQNGTTDSYQIAFSDSVPTTWQFSAFVTSLEVQTPIDDVATYNMAFKITGKPNYSA